MALFLTEEEVTRLLHMPAAIEAVELAFRELGAGRATNRPRRRVAVPKGLLHLMPAALPAARALGFKAYTTFPDGARFHFTLYDSETGELWAIMQADRLGQQRTGAATGVATRHLARPDAAILALFGAGWQARSQLEAVCAVRPIREVRVFSRTPESRERFCTEMRAAVSAALTPVPTPEAALDGADVVVTATAARQPVFDGALLRPGMHLNVVGSNSLLKREVDDETLRRADLIAVDSRDAVPLEGGDLLAALERGVLFPEAVRELGPIVAGVAGARQTADQITLFKSHGLALEDVAVAAHVYQAARAAGLGQELPL
jgi:ornithine cyclodeaminase/alanine dehydrogenase-like protein (mu-crystallin family)